MKKSLIWILIAVMAVTFGALLYFQIMYLDNMAKMREAQFSECVMRSLHATSGYLERQETLHFLQEDISIIESSMADDPDAIEYSVKDASGNVTDYSLKSKGKSTQIALPSPTQDLSDRYRAMQETIRSQYLYQKGLLDEVILTILSEASTRPVTERADSVEIRKFLTDELAANGLEVPFVFAVTTSEGHIMYQTAGFNPDKTRDNYSDSLFTNSGGGLTLTVQFPTKENYVMSPVRFIIPTLILTLILLVIFLYTIIVIFRQKKLSEMKSDFINNMTHELKTPISTISLAGQMLNDESVSKSPAMLKHVAKVITDESKRLRFQVDKVLQMSVFDNADAALKFSEVDANEVIDNVVNTFKLKVEKFGGKIDVALDAGKSEVCVDEMQFTNVIFNLLDNAVKYRREDVAPHLTVSTRNVFGGRLEILVEDNGIGIRRDHLKKIFDKFYRVPTGNLHDVKGFGLGLAYVRKMVSYFQGDIEVESEYGHGTRFIIHLPLSDSECNVKI